MEILDIKTLGHRIPLFSDKSEKKTCGDLEATRHRRARGRYLHGRNGKWPECLDAQGRTVFFT